MIDDTVICPELALTRAELVLVQTVCISNTILTMSFLGGAECSTAGNPLTQFTKHVQNDNTLQRDRLVERGSGGLGESMRSNMSSNGSDQAWINTLPGEREADL